MRHLLPGNSFDDQIVSGLKVRRFHNAMPAMYDGLVRLPTTMPGLETLFAEFAAFPDGRNDDQVDAVCNVASKLRTRDPPRRLYGERLGRIRPIPRCRPADPPNRRRARELSDRPAPTPLLTAFNRNENGETEQWISRTMGLGRASVSLTHR